MGGINTDVAPKRVVGSVEQVGREVQGFLTPFALPMLVPFRPHRVYELVFILQLLEARQALHDVLEVSIKDDVFVHVDESCSGCVEDVEAIKRHQLLVIVDGLHFGLLFVFPGT